MYFDLFLFLFILMGFGASCIGMQALGELLEEWILKKSIKCLPEREHIPALPLPRSEGPYRKSGEIDSEDADNNDQLEAQERFRRYVYVYSRLKGSTDKEEFRRLAEALDLFQLSETMEDAEPNSPRSLAVIHAFSLRRNPEDIPELLALLFESEWMHVPEAVLYALRNREPLSEEIISAVFDIVYTELEEDDEDDYKHLHLLAEDILEEWEEKDPEAIKRFVFLR